MFVSSEPLGRVGVHRGLMMGAVRVGQDWDGATAPAAIVGAPVWVLPVYPVFEDENSYGPDEKSVKRKTA